MALNPYPVRKSVRLRGCDYSQAGAYFLTVCTNGKIYLFGRSAGAEVILNDAGIMIQRWWNKVPARFPGVELDEYVVMPNHFHAIVILPDRETQHAPNMDGPGRETRPDGVNRAASLPAVLQWFKTMTTNEYIHGVKQRNWAPFDKKLWQRTYYEHVVRSEIDLTHIREYIAYNPLNWELDEENPSKG